MDFHIVKIINVHGKKEKWTYTELRKRKVILKCHHLEMTTLMNLLFILSHYLRNVLSSCMYAAAYYLVCDLSSTYNSAYGSVFIDPSHSF